jgi:hypothetical protein
MRAYNCLHFVQIFVLLLQNFLETRWRIFGSSYGAFKRFVHPSLEGVELWMWRLAAKLLKGVEIFEAHPVDQRLDLTASHIRRHLERARIGPEEQSVVGTI